ncbi:membrane protein [Corynebacterium phocae]|uniref:Membrane protein n=1 Tax=Corynebacterium phocae TaxID=161895 RepID=A0A1L7D4K9_9CORY|nr:hypothetical protein [Corynebacterium phocae]APT92943.1 membrane protein [Corynebacterium phocae]KAA8723277.1 hypothetical protein F4V58_08145 [Corynebacterium phocae]
MIHALSYALADSVNALLIGILVAIGIMLPRGQYRKVAALVIVGDWLGVLAASAVVTFIFVGIRDHIEALLASPIAGWLLIVVGLGLAVLSWRSKGQSNALVERLLVPLRVPSKSTVAIGFIMGAVQSLTSLPFFLGLMFLAAGDFGPWITYGGLVVYASLALSLPTLCGLFVAVVRARPDSAAGKLFAKARANSHQVALVGSYLVAAFLVLMGALSLMGLSE